MSYIEQQLMGGGISNAGVLMQTSGSVGGKRHVFVGLTGDHSFIYPTIGGYIVNPFKGKAKAYAGDLAEYDPIASTIKILKTYVAAKATAADDTTISLVRDGYHHRPLIGDIVMVAPSTLTGKGTAVTITDVKNGTDATAGDVWNVTLSATLGVVAKDTVLVEAVEAGANKGAMVTKPNVFFPSDTDFFYNPNDEDAGSDEYYKARYTINLPLLGHGVKMYEDIMSPLPASIKALNKSLWNGWFEI